MELKSIEYKIMCKLQACNAGEAVSGRISLHYTSNNTVRTIGFSIIAGGLIEDVETGAYSKIKGSAVISGDYKAKIKVNSAMPAKMDALRDMISQIEAYIHNTGYNCILEAEI